MMRKYTLALSLAAFVGWAGSAAAADLGGLKDMPPPPPPPPSWTGFYIGLGVGGGAMVSEWTYNRHKCWGWCDEGHGHDEWERGKIDGFGGDGFLGTLQIGYDWQANSAWVVGLFADVDWTNMDFSRSRGRGYDWQDGPDYQENFSVDVNYMWTIGARLGYLLTPDSLWYVFAGYSQLGVDNPNFNRHDYYGPIIWPGYRYNNDNFDGWSIGTGLETRIVPNWSLKVEYRYSQFDSNNVLNFNHYPYYNYGDGSRVGDDGRCHDGEFRCFEHHFRDKLDASVHTGRLVLSYRPQMAPPPIEPPLK